jgi:hypothetical protein
VLANTAKNKARWAQTRHELQAAAFGLKHEISLEIMEMWGLGDSKSKCNFLKHITQ